jgi:alanyl-tRNA synthetase
VKALGDIGPVKIVKEESIGSNLRRIEAVTGTGPVQRVRELEDVLTDAAVALNVSVADVVDGARKRSDEVKALRRELEEAKRRLAIGGAGDLAAAAVDGVVVARVDQLSREGLRELALAVRDKPGIRAVVLAGAPEGGGAALVAAVAPDSGLHAGELIAEGSKAISGGGGKAPDLAVAGGKDPNGIDAALESARTAIGP